jgi:1-acyl-sn-glycerol-3-phosphate acyltransferase
MFVKGLYTAYIAFLVVITFPVLYFIVRFSLPQTATHICRQWVRFMLFASFCPLRVVNENKTQHPAPIIYAANHASYLDVLVILSILPNKLRFVGKKELFRTPIIRTFMRQLGCLSVDRLDLAKGLEDTKHIENTLLTGDSILIFPEGTFSYSSGLRPFRLGAFKIAVETNTPVCPVAINGTRYILRGNEKILRPGKITATIATPISATGKEWQDITALRDSVRNKIARHCGEPSLDFIAAQTVAVPSQRE